MHAVNDLYRSFSPPDYAIGAYDLRYSHYYGPSIAGADPPSFIRVAFERTLRVVADHWYAGYRFREVDYPLSRYQAIGDFEYYVRSIVDVVRADGVQVLLLTQASIYQEEMSGDKRNMLRFPRGLCSTSLGWGRVEYPTSGSLARAMDAFNDTIRKIAREENIRLVDVALELPKTLEYLTDDIHFNPKGAERVASLVADAITAQNPGGTPSPAP